MEIEVKKYKLHRINNNYFLTCKDNYSNGDHVIMSGSVKPLYIDGDIIEPSMLNNKWEKIIATSTNIDGLYDLNISVCNKLFKKEIQIEKSFSGLYDVIVDTDIVNFYISLAKQVANCTGTIKVEIEQDESTTDNTINKIKKVK